MMNNSLVIPEGQSFYTSLNTNTKEEKILFYKAITNPDNKLSDFINRNIYLKNIFFEKIQFTNRDTGEAETGVRVVLFDADNVTYSCGSTGIFKAVCNLVSIFGAPPWDDPLHITIKQKSSAVRQFLTIELLDF